MLEKLRTEKSFTVRYRLILDGVPRYYALKAVTDSNTDGKFIMVGVKNVDEQTRKELAAEAESRTYSEIAGSLASLYEVIYHINIHTGGYKVYGCNAELMHNSLRTDGEDFFELLPVRARKVIHPDDIKRVCDALTKEAMLRQLSEVSSFSFKFRQLVDGQMQYMYLVAFRLQNEQDHVVIGVRNVHAQVCREQEQAAKSAMFNEISKVLAQRYEVIYQVNIETGEYREYARSEKYARLEIGAKGHDFFGECRKNMKRDIYPDDYPMMAQEMEREQLLSSMQETGSTALNYRLILDGEPQYVTLFAIRPSDDSNHVYIAVANVDAAKRREIAYQEALGSAMAMAQQDALTGIRNKHAYVQAETEMDDLISKQQAPPFAVVVCDVNGLKKVNDTQGHSAGDAFIKSACKIICDTFKHSPVYRIGGDEFVVLLKGSDYANREALMAALNAQQEENRSKGLVTVAAGVSVFETGSDLHMQDVFERADDAMYQKKADMKAAQPE
ncbi:MAG: GGDEF domain-containing protein [Oscillospiraceae bacterium]|nr:GGDEF domain-containing protein [Oscillospiraceae bacterium]